MKHKKLFENCRFPNTNYKAKFDFYVNNQYIIKYDGIQHFKKLNNNWESLSTIQEKDNFKNEWCIKHNIPIIRIPY